MVRTPQEAGMRAHTWRVSREGPRGGQDRLAGAGGTFDKYLLAKELAWVRQTAHHATARGDSDDHGARRRGVGPADGLDLRWVVGVYLAQVQDENLVFGLIDERLEQGAEQRQLR